MNQSSKTSITASIVLYRDDAASVIAAVRSIFSTPLEISLTVVDNSPDDSLRSVVEEEGARYVFSGSNIGFGAAHNVALRNCLSTSEYHLILNPDVIFGPDTIPALQDFMQQNPLAGLVMPKVFYPDMREQRLCKLLPTPFDLFMRRFAGRAGYKLAPRMMTRYLLEDIDLTRPRFVPNLSGCFMFLRMEAVRKVGLFDERYFLYLEDVDLCRRIAEQWETIFYPYAHIVHEYGNKSYRDFRHLKLHAISACKYFNKWGWFFDSRRADANRKALADLPSQYRES